MRPSVLPLLQVGHDAVHDMRLGSEEVDGVDITIGGAAVSDLLNVWSKSELRVVGCEEMFFDSGSEVVGERTRDILVEDGVFFEDVVDQAAGVGVEHEHLPLWQ